jgi:hypothetical protein
MILSVETSMPVAIWFKKKRHEASENQRIMFASCLFYDDITYRMPGDYLRLCDSLHRIVLGQ